MGQQQLLLIILGVIVVGIAVAVGITMFSDNSVSANRDAMSTDMMHLAAKARHYFMRPTSLGGGGRSFIGLNTGDSTAILKLVSPAFANNVNGQYSIINAYADSVVFQSVGTAIIPDGNSHPILQMTVTQFGQNLKVVQ
jgi:hypothetical protein